MFNGNAKTTNYVSASQLTAAITAADVATVGSVPVTVVNPAPGGGSAPAATFNVTQATAPQASLTPGTLSFASTSGTTSVAQTAMLANTGTAPLTISSISITGANPSNFAQTNNCGASLAANASCSISVTFTPASASSFTATLSVADNASGSPQTVSLNGTGTAPPDYSVSSSTSAQAVAAGGAATYAINLQATGGYAGSVMLSVTGLPPGATASFSPNPITLGSLSPAIARRAALATTSGTSTLTVQTAPKVQTGDSRNRSWPLVAPALGFLMLLPARRLRKQYLCRLLIIFTILGIGIAVVGCGGGFAIPQQSQTYTLIITGTGTSTSGTTTHTTSVLLTVR
jgi:hypothetical protein